MKGNSYTEMFARATPYIALTVALTAMLGSLYFSEVRHYLPCNLCWYQRILMYPLVVVIAVGILRQDVNLPYYVLPLSLLGQGIATYHYLLEKTNIFSAPTSCQEGIPCTTPWINWWGFATIPFLSMCAFFLITVMCLIAMTSGEPDAEEFSSVPWFQVGTIIALVIAAFLVIYNLDPVRAQGLTLSVPVRGEMTPVDATAAPTVQFLSLAAADPADTAAAGQELYAANCAACHGIDAQGLPNLGTSLAASPLVHASDPAEALAFVRAGRAADHPDNSSGMLMPPSGGHPELSDSDILAIIAYLRDS